MKITVDMKKIARTIEVAALITVFVIRLVRGDLDIGIGIEMKSND